MLIKARVYRFLAATFAFLGLVIFLILYFRNSQGEGLESLLNVSLIGVILIPFLPAAVLSWVAVKCEEKLFNMVSGSDEKTK